MSFPGFVDTLSRVATQLLVQAPARQQPLAPATGAAQEGQQAAQQIKQDLEPLRGFPEQAAQPGTESAAVYQFLSEDVSGALQRAKDDPEFAAAFFNELGPEATATLIASYDAITSSGPMSNDTFNISDEQGTAMLRDFGAALGAASRAGDGAGFDGPAFMRQLTGRDGGESQLDPELAAILLNEGEYTPESAAELGAHVLLHDDPPGYEPIDTHPPHREALLTPYSGAPSDAIGAWPTALRGLMANGASSEVLAIQDTRTITDSQGREVQQTYSPVAERLMDPDLMTSSVVDNGPHGNAPPRVNEIPALVGALLEQPISDLRDNAGDTAAMSAVESVLLAGSHYHGRVNADGANALGAMYVEFTPEILNAGEGRSAFPLARNTELGRFLADSGPLAAGDGSYAITAGLQATGTPPVDPDAAHLPPGVPGSPERFGSWETAIQTATTGYRSQVEAHGPPQRTNANGNYLNVDDLAREIADIDGEFLQGVYGQQAIAAADLDSANRAKQGVFNVVTDYVGYGVGLGPQGPALGGAATIYNTHIEGPLLEAMFPTDAAAGTFGEVVPAEQQALLGAQATRIVDSAGRSGAVTLPDNLRDPETGGLREPAPEEAEQFARELAAFIESDPTIHHAVDLARTDLENRTTALDAGQYRGGG